MNEVILHGEMAERFGNVFKLEVENASEALRCLNANFPGEFMSMVRRGNWYLVRELPDGQFALDENTLFLGMQGSRLHLIPALEGAGDNGGGVKMVIGITLIAASLLIPGMQGFGLAAMSAAWSTTMFAGITYGALGLVGLSIALGGLAMVLSPGLGHDDGTKNDSSSLVGGGIGTVQEGDGVPIVFGHMMVTPKPITSQIITAQIDVGNNNYQYHGNPDPTYQGNSGDYQNLYN